MPMSLSDILAKDYRFMHDARTVHYQVRTGAGSYAQPVIVTDALRRVVRRKDILNLPQSLLNRQLVTWHLWAEKLGSIEPKVNDRIDDGESLWQVVDAEVMDEGQRHRLVCVRER